MDERIRHFLNANPSANLLTYQPLTEGSFRLVDLLPGSHADNIALNVADYRIQDHHSYEALSYTWGQQVDIVYIRCNDCDLAVTNSLVEALRQFRFTDKARRLWIDQCCIDQSNTDERSSQVNMMRQIYGNASRVLSWLGPASRADGTRLGSLLDQFEATIKGINSDMSDRQDSFKIAGLPLDESVPGSEHVFVLNENRSMFPSDEWLTKFGLPIVTAQDWTVFEQFLCNAYFRRIWIIQEIQSSSKALLRWGETEIEWVQVHNAVRFCVANGIMERPGFPGTGWVRFLSPFASLKSCTLSTWLSMIKYHECTDKRDKIFALLGISSSIGDGQTIDNNVKLEADYALPWEFVYRDAMKAICKASSQLQILSAFQHKNTSHPSRLPSWVGDFDSEPVLTDFLRGGHSASGSTLPRIIDHEDDNVMAANGLIVDCVIAMNEPMLLPMVSMGHFAPVSPRHFEAAWSLVRASGISGSHTETTPLKSCISALTQTLRCSSIFWQTQTDLRHAEIENLMSFAIHQINGSIASFRSFFADADAAKPSPRTLFYPEAGIEAAFCAAAALDEDTDSYKSTEIVSERQKSILKDIVDNVFISDTAEEQKHRLQLLAGAVAIVQSHPSYIPTASPNPFAYDPLNLRNRRFFVTQQGNMGIGPETLQIGDEISVLYGGPVPYAIRPAGKGEHEFVGACYVHDFMDGQAIQLKDTNGYVEREIILR